MLQFFSTLASNPKRLFLADGLGACLTVLLLFGMVLPLQTLFGMPPFVLRILALIAAALASYSLLCFFFVKGNPRVFFRIIAAANSLYCGLTVFFIICYFEKLTVLGLTYFVIEMILILGLVFLELKVAELKITATALAPELDKNEESEQPTESKSL